MVLYFSMVKKIVTVEYMKFNFQYQCAYMLSLQLFATLWTVTHQTPLSMRFSWQEYWSGVPLPSLHFYLCSAKATIDKI